MLNMLKVSVLPRAQKQQTIHGLLKKSGFQQVPLLGVPIIRTIVFWGLYWGPLILGMYHLGLGLRI